MGMPLGTGRHQLAAQRYTGASAALLRDIERRHRAVIRACKRQRDLGAAPRIEIPGHRHEDLEGAPDPGSAMRAASGGDREGAFELAGDPRDLVVERILLCDGLDPDEQEVVTLARLPGDR